MKVVVEPTPRFLRDLRKLAARDRNAAIDAIKRFVDGERSKALNFERVTGQKSDYTIRANRSIRVLLEKSGDHLFKALRVGNHDYIYTAKGRSRR